MTADVTMFLKLVVIAVSATLCVAIDPTIKREPLKVLVETLRYQTVRRNDYRDNDRRINIPHGGYLVSQVKVLTELVLLGFHEVLVMRNVTQLPYIMRPCALNDQKCIQDNLLSNSRCKRPAQGSAPAVFTVPRARFEAPAFNSSYVDINLIIRGLHRCFVSEYYMNRKSNVGVLALNCPGLNFESNRIMFQHHSLREDDVFQYWINGSYPLVRLTTTMANMDKLDLCKEFTYADVAALPKFDITPKDRATKNYLSKDWSALNIYERETFLYRAKLLARAFINSAICDFGCN